MDVTRILHLLREQQASGYQDVAGAKASVTVPMSDRLVTRLVSESIPRTAPLREIELRAAAGNRFSARVRLSRPALMPSITVNLAIDRQPQFPSNPVIVLRLLSTGLLSVAGSALQFLSVLPPGIRMDGDFIIVNLRTLLEQRGLAEYLGYLEHLEIATEEGRFIVSVRAALPPQRR